MRDLKDECEWIPSGSPWLDKLKQIKGDEKAIELRVDNAIDAARRRGSNVFRNIDKQLEVEKYVLQMFDKKAEAETKPAATEPKKRFSIRKPKVKE